MNDSGKTTFSGDQTVEIPDNVPEIASGFQVGEYEVIGTLGQGAMGTVYLARDNTGHEVALKMYREGLGNSTLMGERFRREAEATKMLRRHPYILTVYTSGRQGLYHYMAMEKIENSRTLKDLMDVGLPAQQALHTTIKLATALQYAHEHGVVHRDVKPDNVLVDEFGEPLLADFGVADLQDWPDFTAAGALTGTPMYMAPEQARSEAATPQSDVYALGVVLYQALTGDLPYDLPAGYNTTDVLDAVKLQKLVRPRKRDASISRDLDYVLMRALASNPADRYPNARGFARDLESIYDGRPLSRLYNSPFGMMGRFIRRHKALFVTIGMLCTAAAAGYAFMESRVTQVSEQQLLHLAWQRNAELSISERSSGPAPVRTTMQAGFNEYISDRFQNAAEHYRYAAACSNFEGNRHNSMIAQLEEARCRQMLGTVTGLERAEQLYSRILEEPEASPAVASQALFEMVVLHLHQNDAESAAAWFEKNRTRVEDTPLLKLLPSVLEGTAEAFASQLSGLPVSQQNDAWMAQALRPGLPANQRAVAVRYVLEFTARDHDWPSPLARKMAKRP